VVSFFETQCRKPPVKAALVVSYLQFPIQVCFPCSASPSTPSSTRHRHIPEVTSGFNSTNKTNAILVVYTAKSFVVAKHCGTMQVGRLPSTSTEFGKRAFSVAGHIVLNQLPDLLKTFR